MADGPASAPSALKAPPEKDSAPPPDHQTQVPPSASASASVEAIRQDLRDIRIFCGYNFPFVVIPLSYVRVVATPSVPSAGVDERGTLAVNPQWWSSLDARAKRFVALHECLHLCLLHPFRCKGYNKAVYNIAADAKINDALIECNAADIRFSSMEVITLDSISAITGTSVAALKKMSTEEIADLLSRRFGISGSSIPPPIPDDLLSGAVEGAVVQEGDPSVSTAEDLEEAWRGALERAESFARQAGNMPAGLARLVGEVLEVKPPWRLIVRFGVKNHSKQDSSFAYPSRRGDEYPGQYGYRYSVWCLIDTSGSISQEMLEYFLGVVKYEARRADIYAVPWDAEAYEVIRANSPSEVARKVAARMKGGGGTVCGPVLEKVLSLMKPGDAVIMLTDGAIFDAGKQETKELMRKVAAKAGFAMIGYTCIPVEAPGFSTAKLDLVK